MTITHNPLHDAKERLQALDPTQSFIVQAPAGSGKTELLSQRFLVLLNCVKQPEEILAITFTKKSAAEMRARIIHSLKKAADLPEPQSAHEKQTWTLAKRVLERNEQLQWNLLENPNRLQIQTIDSFNASLTRQLPLLSNFGAPLEIIDDANSIYRETVQEFLSHLEENFTWVTAIEKLLLHVDNDLTRVEDLLIEMLAKRDQWLPYIISNINNPQLRKTLEKHLSNVIIDCLDTLVACFPIEYEDELIQLAQYAANNLNRNQIDSNITLCEELTSLPGSTIQDKMLWDSLSSLLLTKESKWRKQVNKNLGFPAPSETKNPEEKKLLEHFKNRMQILLENISCHDELEKAFDELQSLPHAHYLDHQWETLEALHDILRVLVAQLKLSFQQHGKIDYIENAQAALIALGSDEAPTDMTLALDYRIQHILIDEFQDTSNGQYRLLEKLIYGWQTGDGRSLFVVGDPMQSIYRFREAEVGLFIRARKHGIGHLSLTPLTLSVNFRSVPGVVNWVNEHFAKVLPSFEDIASGAVSYSPSIANQDNHSDTLAVNLHPSINADKEIQADAIIKLIQTSKQHNPHDKIAVLVRSRSYLSHLIPALKSAGIHFRALDIEPLAARPVIQDLLALTRAMLHPADKVAWLAILRAPWCGMSLSDLLVISNDKLNLIILEQLKKSDVIAKLSIDGQQRLQRIFPILETSLKERRRYSLRQWIEYTWLQLGGAACVDQFTDLEDAQAFFNLLDHLDEAWDLTDLKKLNNAIEKLYAAPNNQADETLQIMTIHNSKGLEFDIVILPHLERKASQDDKPLMQWMERPRTGDSSDLILAPIHATGEKNNLIYDYIKRQQNIKTDYENGRLLYVAATRAKKQLHLFFNLENKKDKAEIKDPSGNSLLKKLWPTIKSSVEEKKTQCTNTSLESQKNKKTTFNHLKRLTLNWKNPLTKNLFSAMNGYHQKNSGFQLLNNTSKYIGTLVHQILQQISLLGTEWWLNQSEVIKIKYIKNHLLQLGMQQDSLLKSCAIVEKAIKNTIQDPRGLWILQQHSEAKSEFAITTPQKNLIIDRTFIDDNTGIRWIIDYKSSFPEGSDVELFLDNEKKQYEEQLKTYYLAFKEIENRPIKLGLYFPLVPAWREWKV